MSILGYLLSQVFLIGWSLDGTLKPSEEQATHDQNSDR